MKFIIKLFPEITIKSDSVRVRFIKILTSNIRNILKNRAVNVAILRHWDHLEIKIKHPQQTPQIIGLLIKIPGIHDILLVDEFDFSTLDDVARHSLNYYQTLINNKTFCVRVKRRGQHPFTSVDVEKYVGHVLNQQIPSATVNLTRADVIVNLEIKNNKLLLVRCQYNGLGGFPIGTQNEVLSLISGGYDSSVSSYMLMRRGCKVHYCFFNLGHQQHEISVKQIAHLLWHQYGSSHKVRFITIDFSDIVDEILDKIDHSYMGVILKRMMIRAAAYLTKQYDIDAIITGEALGQVSSQTLANLRMIDNASDTLILRPLISYDKQKIIEYARKIGTEAITKTIPEFCGTLSNNPTVKAVSEKITIEERKFSFALLHKVIDRAENIDIRLVGKQNDGQIEKIDTVDTVSNDDIIIDIRPSEQQEDNPLIIANKTVKTIPFYKLKRHLAQLDPKKNYLLYCDRGIMSQLQAVYMKEHGFTHISILKKIKK